MARKPKSYDFDLIVIGSGSGGGVAAHIVNDMGKKVAIVEQEKIGGECPNFGCVPTKALLTAAEVYDEAKNGAEFGIRAATINFNYAAIKAWKDYVVLRTGTSEGDRAFEADGISVLRGHAHFINQHEISVGGKRYHGKKFLIATGTHDAVPPIDGLAETGYMTYKEAINLTKLPKSVFIIGGGAIGCEFAHLFSVFGTHVTIAEAGPRLLAKEDAEVGQLVEAIFSQQRNMNVLTGIKIIKVDKERGKKVVYFKHGYDIKSVRVDEVMLAAGKHANVDIGLENAGVKYTPRNIIVDDTMRTSRKHIYAAGDVAGPYMFTHTAAYQSRIVAYNMFHKKPVKADYRAVPRCVFITPEIASVGMTEDEIKHAGIKYKVGATPISVVGRSNTSNKDVGFVKVMAAQNGVLLGASIVSPRAGEMIHELTLAIQHGLTAEAVAETIHAFPTWSEAVRVACLKIR